MYGYKGDQMMHNFENHKCKHNSECILIDKTDDFFTNLDLESNFSKKKTFYTCSQPQLLSFFASAKTSTGWYINRYLSEYEDLYDNISQIVSSRDKKMTNKIEALRLESEQTSPLFSVEDINTNVILPSSSFNNNNGVIMNDAHIIRTSPFSASFSIEGGIAQSARAGSLRRPLKASDAVLMPLAEKLSQEIGNSDTTDAENISFTVLNLGNEEIQFGENGVSSNTNNILLNIDDEEIELEVLLNACREFGFSDESMIWAERMYQITSDDEEENATNLQHLVSKEFLEDWCQYTYNVSHFLSDYLRNPINGLTENVSYKEVTKDHEKVREYKDYLRGNGYPLKNYSKRTFILATTNTIKAILMNAPNKEPKKFYMDLEKVLRMIIKQRCRKLKEEKNRTIEESTRRLEVMKVELERQQQEKIEMEQRHKRDLELQRCRYIKEEDMILKWTPPPRTSGFIYIIATLNMAINRRLKGGRTARPIQERLGNYNRNGTAQDERYYLFFCRETNDIVKSEELIFKHFAVFKERSTVTNGKSKSSLTEVLNGVPLPLAIRRFKEIMDGCNNSNRTYDEDLEYLLREVRTDSDNIMKEARICDLVRQINDLPIEDVIRLFNSVAAINIDHESPKPFEYNSIHNYIGHFKYSLICHLKLDASQKLLFKDLKPHDIQDIIDKFMLAHLFI